MKDTTNFYYVAVVVIGISLWLLWFLTKTPFGQLMVSIRDNAKRVAYLGFKVTQTKAMVYVISAGSAGTAGSIVALFQNVISPDLALGPGTSFQVILITMVGGVGSFFGPIWGSAIFTILHEFTSRYMPHLNEVIMGGILILVMLYFPAGFAGVLTLVRRKEPCRLPEKTTAKTSTGAPAALARSDGANELKKGAATAARLAPPTAQVTMMALRRSLSTDAESGAWPPGRDVEVDIKNPEVEKNPEGDNRSGRALPHLTSLPIPTAAGHST